MPEPGCCAGNSPMTWSFCLTMSENEYACETALECTWIGGDPDSELCIPPTREPTPSPTSAWPTPSPSDEAGCCYGATPSTNSFCAGLDGNANGCEAAASCEFIVTDDPDTCRLTTTTAPPAPTYDPEGCCTGYSARTFSFCSGYTNGDRCEAAGVCSWIPTNDPEECQPPTDPPSFTNPPAPTTGNEGCCTGNSPRTWSYCGTIEEELICVMADECTWHETDDPDSEQCQPPTTDPTPSPTPRPTPDTNGCCSGTAYDPNTWTFCAGIDNDVACEAAAVCDWNAGDDADCTPPTSPPSETQPPAPTHSEGCCYGDGPYASFCYSLDERPCTGAPNCEWMVTDDPEECKPTTTTAPPAPTYGQGCCTGYSPRTFSFCNAFDDGDDCEAAGVCSWIETNDPDECQPPTTTTAPPAPTFDPVGCCAGNSPRTWSFCTGIDEVLMCMEADECSWIAGDPDAPECIPPTPEPTPPPAPTTPWPTPTPEEGCCVGHSPQSWTYCSAIDDQTMCDRAGQCDWLVGDPNNPECIPPTSVPTPPPAPTSPWPTGAP